VITSLPPMIRQIFNAMMLMARHEIYHLSHLKVIEKCRKKIRNHGARKKQQFDLLISKYMEKYEQAKIKEESRKKKKKA
jgi:hypothetical protein